MIDENKFLGRLVLGQNAKFYYVKSRPLIQPFPPIGHVTRKTNTIELEKLQFSPHYRHCAGKAGLTTAMT